MMTMTDAELQDYMTSLHEPVSVELTREGWQLVKTALFNEARRERTTAERCRHGSPNRDSHTRYATHLSELRQKVSEQTA